MKKYNNKPNMIGPFIKEARKKKNFTKKDLCRELELLGIPMSRNELYRIENSKMSVKDFELVAFCIVLDINFKDIRDSFEIY